MRLALGGETLPFWVTANRQTGGRGQAGRSWTSFDGNLQASVAMHSAAPLAQAGELALIAGISLIDAVRATSPLADRLTMRLKWPNDLLIDGAKAGGILVETTTAQRQSGFVAVIGFGLNVRVHPSELAGCLAIGLGRPATSLASHGLDVSATTILEALSSAFETWIQAWDCGRSFRAHIAPAWQSRAGCVGEAISVSTETGKLHGRYRGIDDHGHLLIELASGVIRVVTHGDVALTDAIEERKKE